jgi:hypothetical protein
MLENNEKIIINKVHSNNNKKRERNISYHNIFSCKSIKINLLKGDKYKLNNEELEKKLHNSINKKKNSPYKLVYNNNNQNLLLSFQNSNKNHSFNFNKNYRCNSINIKSNHNKDNYCTDSSNKDLNLINSNYIKVNLNSIYQGKSEFKKELCLEKTYERGIISLNESEIKNIKDKNNPYIYSYIDWHPFSFCTGHRKWGYENGELKAPSPIFLDNEEWCKKKMYLKMKY